LRVQPVRERRARTVPLEAEFEAAAPRLGDGGAGQRGVRIGGGHRRRTGNEEAGAKNVDATGTIMQMPRS
ncbi:hypothetical protein M3616_23050, partial [Bacillus velezensis]|nr:hypothetical protein [Bacillus velezensis]